MISSKNAPRLISGLTLMTVLIFAFNVKAAEPFWLGADISATTQLEADGIFSYDKNGNQVENTQLMKSLGMNAIRLRVWVNPVGGWSSKEDVLEMAKRAKQLDMAIMIDFHYSDWWADPGKQNIPAAWADLNYAEMKIALAYHTMETLHLLKANDIDVRWVQVGNETTNGFLWPMGHVDNMRQYAGLSNAGYDAVKAVYPDAIVITHLDNGFDNKLYNWFFDQFIQCGGKFDMIGISVYPYWAIMYNHQPDEETTLRNTIDNINRLYDKYHCDVMIVETGVEAKKPEQGYKFMKELIQAAATQTNGHCPGVFYWAPECCHGGYELGAFINDRPSKILDAFTEAAKLFGVKQD